MVSVKRTPHHPSRARLVLVSLPLALALLDAVAGLYLLKHALRHRRRALLVTAVVLLLTALALAVIGLLPEAGELGRLPVLPAQQV